MAFRLAWHQCWPGAQPPAWPCKGQRVRAPGSGAQFRHGRIQHIARREVAGGNGHAHRLKIRLLQRLERRFSKLFRKIEPSRTKRLGDGAPPFFALFRALACVRDTADARARLARDNKTLPPRIGRAAARGDDFHLIAIFQHMAQRHDLAIHLGANRAVAHLAMHFIGEINRRGAARQFDQIALGREAENPIAMQFKLGMFQKFLRLCRVFQDFEKVAHPRIALLVTRRSRPLLIAPMRGHTIFCNVMHFLGADLHFDLGVAPFRHGHAGMQALIAIGLRR